MSSLTVALGEGESFLCLGAETIAVVLPPLPSPVVLDAAYAEFLGRAPGARLPLARLRLFCDEEEPDGWGEAPEVFRSAAWSLREDGRRRFVVGTAFDPPRPYWVAETLGESCEYRVVHLPSDPPVPLECAVEPALRLISRLVLMEGLVRGARGLVTHAAAAEVAGRAFLFVGRSGAGKSTLSRLLLGAGCEVVNDDRILVTCEERSGFTAWGTPWPGEQRIARNRRAPLGGLLFLEKDERSVAEPIGEREALDRLLPMASIPWYDAGLVAPALDLCGRLVREVPAHVLRFRPDASAAAAVLAVAGLPAAGGADADDGH